MVTDLATIAFGSDMRAKIDYEFIIKDFISKNTKGMIFFNRRSPPFPLSDIKRMILFK